MTKEEKAQNYVSVSLDNDADIDDAVYNAFIAGYDAAMKESEEIIPEGFKTRKEWLESLPKPYRGQALKNAKTENLNSLNSSQSDALWGAFIWQDSPQGHNYWSHFTHSLEEQGL